MSLMHKPQGSHVTNYEKLYLLCEGLPPGYRDQSRARLCPAVEGMTLHEADDRLHLRLSQHGVLQCADLGCPVPHAAGLAVRP